MEGNYTKLPGKGTRRGSFIGVTSTTSHLWLGEHHLLLVDSNGYQESYKRFAFRDIQSLVITKTNAREIKHAVFLGLAALIFLCAVLINHIVGWILLGFCASIFLVLSLVNALRGPTCRTSITTAVQTDELASLNRIPRTQKILARLQPLILAAQTAGSDNLPPQQVPPVSS
jgi:hypothetical protein